MPSTVDDKSKIAQGRGNPHNLPRDGKCPIDDLPDELLSCIFQLGVEMDQEGWDDGQESSNDDDEDDGESTDESSTDQASSDEAGANEGSVDSRDTYSMTWTFRSVIPDLDDDKVRHSDPLPFQVLVSHVCRRWRSVSLDTYRFWTELSFSKAPRLSQAKEYISRSNGLPLTIELDCSTDDDSSDDEDLSDISEDETTVLSLEEVNEILDLLEPAISQWGRFIFHASRYSYVHALMLRLHNLPAAPCLESFQVHLYEEWIDSDVTLADKTPYLPFHGRAPSLQEAVFWGIHIDWEGALPNFLRGLRDFELSYLTKDVRPTYATFAKIIKNSPELRTLTLSLAGPILPDNVVFDSEEAWGPVPLAIPSLTELTLQFHDPKYAAALVQHLDLPNVTHLVLNFDEEDYSGFVQTLAKPVEGRNQSLLRQITHLKISGLPCDISSVEILLSQLMSLKSLNLKLYGPEEETIFNKLIDPWVFRMGPTSSSTTMGPRVDIPKIFCPKLEEITTTGVGGKTMRTLLTARRAAGARLKRIHMATTDILSDDELWIKENVEELEFFDPSDSEDEFEDADFLRDLD